MSLILSFEGYRLNRREVWVVFGIGIGGTMTTSFLYVSSVCVCVSTITFGNGIALAQWL